MSDTPSLEGVQFNPSVPTAPRERGEVATFRLSDSRSAAMLSSDGGSSLPDSLMNETWSRGEQLGAEQSGVQRIAGAIWRVGVLQTHVIISPSPSSPPKRGSSGRVKCEPSSPGH